MNLIHIIDCYYWIWIQSAIDNERCLWLEAPMQMLTTEKYIAPRAPPGGGAEVTFEILTLRKNWNTVVLGCCCWFLATKGIRLHIFYAYQNNFLRQRGTSIKELNHVFLSDKFVWVLSNSFTKKECNYVFQYPSNKSTQKEIVLAKLK